MLAVEVLGFMLTGMWFIIISSGIIRQKVHKCSLCMCGHECADGDQ